MSFVEVTKESHVGMLTLNRPEVLNSLSSEVLSDFRQGLRELNDDQDVYVIVVTGRGRAFAAGADISKMTTMNVNGGKAFSELGSRICLKLENLAKPSIAAVNGYALGGGCEIALACDIRIAADDAMFGLPEVSLGIMPGFGGTQRTPRMVGVGQAMEMILTAKPIDAQKALDIGLVNRVVPKDQLMEEVIKLAKQIAGQPQIAVRAAKQSVRRGLQADIATAITYESLAFSTCFDTEDQKDAMIAFLEKRKLDGFKNR
ncbi:MAG: enoyl-CoA hydratase/isomerase family protein [Firmicutes bacterium]|nr:enoyl-CoA hydratase/isomerase family protein [Bacillota bacterium]